MTSPELSALRKAHIVGGFLGIIAAHLVQWVGEKLLATLKAGE